MRGRFGFYKEATELLGKAKEHGGGIDASLLAGEAYVLWKSGHPDDARSLFERIVTRINPDHAYTLQTFAEFCEDQDDLERASQLRNQLYQVEMNRDRSFGSPTRYDEDPNEF